MNGRSRADADDWAGETGGAKPFGSFDGEGALLFGHGFELCELPAVVRRTGMRHDAAEVRRKPAPDLDQPWIGWGDTRAMAIAVDFDQHLDRHRFRIDEGPDRISGFQRIEDDAQLAAIADQL